MAFCDRELLYHGPKRLQLVEGKFVAAECRNQHATGVRSPEVPLALGSGTRLTKSAMPKKIALLFAGQGAQCVGMGRDLAERYPVAGGSVS